MKIKTLRMRNFRPFFGRHELDLTPAGNNPLVLIHGENQSGKTAFFLALYWCLYGHAKSRVGAILPVFQRGEKENDYLINRKAVEQGDYEMSVEVVFDHEGKEWHLTRKAVAVHDPLEGGEFKIEPLLRIGAEPIVTADIERRVNDVLHSDAAQFYFFDGEMLSQYEQWLADPEQAQRRVREAIERTVGISAFRLGKHLADVASEFQADVNRAERKEKKNQDLLDARDRAERQRTNLETEVRNYETDIGQLSAQIERIQKTHGDLTEWNKARVEISTLESRVEEAQRREETAIMQIQTLVRERYWLPLSRQAQAIEAGLMKEIDASLKGHSHLLAASIRDHRCAVCGAKLDESTRTRLRGQVQQHGMGAYHSVETLQDGVLRAREARRFIDPSGMELLETLENALTEARVEIRNCSDQADMLRRAHPIRGDLEIEMKRLDDLYKQMGGLEASKREAEAELLAVSDEVKSLDARISRSGTADPALGRRSRAAALAAAAFENALGKFAERAREEVQRGATKAFALLVDDEGYDGIDIDQRYTVRPVDDSGRVQTAPSSGGQQLLTLALIAGLNSAAVHDAPIVMDTPFGRLDVGNRERILRWVQTLVKDKDQQVVLMVHSGELSKENLTRWNIVSGRSYTITTRDVHEHAIEEA